MIENTTAVMAQIKKFKRVTNRVNEEMESKATYETRKYLMEVSKVAKEVYEKFDDILFVWNMLPNSDSRFSDVYDLVNSKYDTKDMFIPSISENGIIIDYKKFRNTHFVLSIVPENNEYIMLLSAEHRSRCSIPVIYCLPEGKEFRLSRIFECDAHCSYTDNKSIVIMRDDDDYNKTYEMDGDEFLRMFKEYKNELIKFIYNIKTDLENKVTESYRPMSKNNDEYRYEPYVLLKHDEHSVRHGDYQNKDLKLITGKSVYDVVKLAVKSDIDIDDLTYELLNNGVVHVTYEKKGWSEERNITHELWIGKLGSITERDMRREGIRMKSGKGW